MASKKVGGQLSNANSIKHGFYSKKLPAVMQPQLAEAAKVEGLDQEIAFLRLKLRLLAACESPAEISLAFNCTADLAKVIKVRHTISIDHNESIKNAIALVLTEIAAPLKIRRLIR
ncbi:MAG: hypothetical protein D4R38_03080 [Dehalococcoidia bacterium]|nr:MAG: hypothetical protein D4R38_03080 [Dehalococcoidia bacterium]